MNAALKNWKEWLRNGLFLSLSLGGGVLAVDQLWAPHPPVHSMVPPKESKGELESVVQSVDNRFEEHWKTQGVEPTGSADRLTVARRLSLALSGTIPSLQEIRALEAQPEAEQIQWWVSHLFADRRSSDYLAERLARAYVGVEEGPFLVYRRRRLVDWLSEALQENRPYNQIAQALIDSSGIWTSQPEVNFVSVTIEPKKGPDPVKLAARVSRAFLGVRIDCVQCHDGKLGSQWKQKDFHQLAAFFGPAEMSLVGLGDNPKRHYDFRYLGEKEPKTVTPRVPWESELLPEEGPVRKRLAEWVTAPGNRPFARAMVNRIWALMFNRPLITPVDDIPLKGPYPPGLELLAEDFTAHGYDLKWLIRVIASTRLFQLESQSAAPDQAVSPQTEEYWAAFPVTRLRPEQMAGSVTQASSLTTIDTESSVLFRIKRSIDQTNFVKRYGDSGEDEFDSRSGTIPQRLLMMNGEMVQNYIKTNPFLNASSRIGALSPDDASAVETAFLAIFTRRPSVEESAFFTAQIHQPKAAQRSKAMPDLYWALLNSTEFSWNH